MPKSSHFEISLGSLTPHILILFYHLIELTISLAVFLGSFDSVIGRPITK